VVYTQDIDKLEIPALLIELSKNYFENLGKKPVLEQQTKVIQEEKSLQVHQCSSCLTIYDAQYGDPTQSIPKGTPFEDLPNDFSCSLCDEPASSFEKVELKQLM
jgi:rubredoxin